MKKSTIELMSSVLVDSILSLNSGQIGRNFDFASPRLQFHFTMYCFQKSFNHLTSILNFMKESIVRRIWKF